jgi:acyl-[acyl-carrier-protein] desaturase
MQFLKKRRSFVDQYLIPEKYGNPDFLPNSQSDTFLMRSKNVKLQKNYHTILGNFSRWYHYWRSIANVWILVNGRGIDNERNGWSKWIRQWTVKKSSWRFAEQIFVFIWSWTWSRNDNTALDQRWFWYWNWKRSVKNFIYTSFQNWQPMFLTE